MRSDSNNRRSPHAETEQSALVWLRRTAETVRRAFSEFLTIPSLVIVGFLALAAIFYFLDEARIARVGSGVGLFGTTLFGDPERASDLLGVIAGSIITVTSITLSLLLVAVQQGAAALTSQVFDQFLRRRTNQFYFGSFIGLALFCLIGLATITPTHNPVFTLAAAFVMTVIALYMLILLIYTTIDQMRPVVIIEAIHDHTLSARRCQQEFLANTRRAARLPASEAFAITAENNGFLVRIDVDGLEEIARKSGTAMEVVILASIGDYVSFGDAIAELRSAGPIDSRAIEPKIRDALHLESQRDLNTDPAFGVEQISIIGWTCGSTAKSNPEPAMMACRSLRDILARWIADDSSPDNYQDDKQVRDPSIVVYTDNVMEQLVGAFESLSVVASESMQHQLAAEIYGCFATLFPRLTPSLQDRAEMLILRSVSALGEHVLTRELDTAILAVADSMRSCGKESSAESLLLARHQLEGTIGNLNSRGTRATAGKA